MYKLNKPNTGETESKTILRLSDNACIPFEPTSIDYQEYLDWVSQGNTPLPADEDTQ